MRTIETHKVNPVNDLVDIRVLDEPGSGGANHQYVVILPDRPDTYITFQNGPIAEVGVNGLTQEVLLAIVVDRLAAFQAGPFACKENAAALVHCQHAQEVLLSRTRARMARGVEGTHAV